MHRLPRRHHASPGLTDHCTPMSAHARWVPTFRDRPWGRRRWVIVFSLAGLIALTAGIYFGRGTGEPSTREIVGTDAAPLLGISLPDTKGREQSLSQWNG